VSDRIWRGSRQGDYVHAFTPGPRRIDQRAACGRTLVAYERSWSEPCDRCLRKLGEGELRLAWAKQMDADLARMEALRADLFPLCRLEPRRNWWSWSASIRFAGEPNGEVSYPTLDAGGWAVGLGYQHKLHGVRCFEAEIARLEDSAWRHARSAFGVLQAMGGPWWDRLVESEDRAEAWRAARGEDARLPWDLR